MPATLEFNAQGGWVTCLVTFPNEDVALATLQRWDAEDHEHSAYALRWVCETEEHRVPEGWDRLYAYLYPKCHHGMDATLCMDPYGPNHFGTMEQEYAGML